MCQAASIQLTYYELSNHVNLQDLCATFLLFCNLTYLSIHMKGQLGVITKFVYQKSLSLPATIPRFAISTAPEVTTTKIKGVRIN